MLQAELQLDEVAKAGMNNRTKLHSFYEMKWASRAYALYTFNLIQVYFHRMTALEFLEADGDGKARSYLLSIQR